MTLAIHGGKPFRTKLFPAYRTVGVEEREAVGRVLESGVLSKFLGCEHPQFAGGREIQGLEAEWAARFGVRHAVAVNSCTSGLYAAVGALGIEPGDEVIVSPYTMCASASAPLVYGAIPVFADVEPDHFCLDPASVEAQVSERTRAIVAVDLFGQPYDVRALRAVAERHNLRIIEDAAQAPGARFEDDWAGTFGDVGVFSLNYHKHIHCGEGGIVVTDDDDLAERVRLIRNHAEAVVGSRDGVNLVNMLGFNYRMTEVEAAIARCQVPKLDALVAARRRNCEWLAGQLESFLPVRAARPRAGAEHVYYLQAFLWELERAEGLSRDLFVDAVKAELPLVELRESEGVKLSSGYVAPLYLQPMFQQRVCMGSKGYPFSLARSEISYRRGLCPVAEALHSELLFSHELMHAQLQQADLEDVVGAFRKVWEQREELKGS